MINLHSVYQAFERRSQHFLHVIAETARSTGKARDRSVAHVVIELQTALGFVARSAYLAGTVGGWRANRTKMRPTFATAADSLLAAARVVRRKPVAVPGRDEPAWHSANHMVRVATRIAPANSTAFVNAASAFPDVFATMLASRNFYAHRAQNTRTEAERNLSTRFGLVTNGHLTDALLSIDGRGVPLIETWIWNYLDVAELLCER